MSILATLPHVSDVVTALLVVLLVFVAPILGRIRYESFRKAVARDPALRLQYYWRSLPWKYALAAVPIVLYLANGRHGYGVHLLPTNDSSLGDALPLVIGVGLGAALLRWRIATAKRRVKVTRAIRGFADLLPRTAEERRVWVVLAISAGVTEEILYRSFMMTVVTNVVPSADRTTIVVITAAAFGLAHAYQGLKGVALTALVGAVLGSIVLTAGLLVAMAIHALIDLRILIVPPDLASEVSTPPDDGMQ